MPVAPPPSGFGKFTHYGSVTVTAGATAHTMGAWTTIVDPVPYDVYALGVQIEGVSASGAAPALLMDVAVAPSGGGNEQIVIPYFDGGEAAVNGPGKFCIFPLYIPAGKIIRARTQSSTASKTCEVRMYLYGRPFYGHSPEAGIATWDQYGAVPSSSTGTAITSGAGAFGTTVQITSSTSRPYRWITVGMDNGTNTAISAGLYLFRISLDSARNIVVGDFLFWAVTTAEDMTGVYPSLATYYPIPAGSSLYATALGAASEALAVIIYAA